MPRDDALHPLGTRARHSTVRTYVRTYGASESSLDRGKWRKEQEKRGEKPIRDRIYVRARTCIPWRPIESVRVEKGNKRRERKRIGWRKVPRKMKIGRRRNEWIDIDKERNKMMLRESESERERERDKERGKEREREEECRGRGQEREQGKEKRSGGGGGGGGGSGGYRRSWIAKSSGRRSSADWLRTGVAAAARVVGGPRSSSPLSLSSPPLVLVSSLASSSLLCFASCPLFADSSFFTSSTVYSRSFAFASAFTLPTDTIRGNEAIIESQSRAKDGIARIEKDEKSGGGRKERKERKRTDTRNEISERRFSATVAILRLLVDSTPRQ